MTVTEDRPQAKEIGNARRRKEDQRLITGQGRYTADWNLLGQAYLALGRYEDAEKTYNSAVELASPAERKQLAGTFGFEGVGDGYLKAKRRPDAARAYRRALDLDPDNREIQNKVSKVKG